MSRTEQVLARHWRAIATMTALVALFGLGAILWARVDGSDRKAEQLATEADLRGTAVSTLATDVRRLRTQLKSEGKTPVAPDPTAAVNDLPDRAAVPVPIPGPKGDKGDPGKPGKPAPTITPSPGKSGEPGSPGQPGSDATGAPGQNGKDGANGADGQPGRDGTDGQNGQPPAGWTYTDPQGVTYDCERVADFDPDAPRYSCTARSSSSSGNEPSPSPKAPSSGLNLAGLAPDRRRY